MSVRGTVTDALDVVRLAVDAGAAILAVSAAIPLALVVSAGDALARATRCEVGVDPTALDSGLHDLGTNVELKRCRGHHHQGAGVTGRTITS
ncbi:hypothetical protein ACVH9Z_32015 [Rhodococcus opacus]|uniref:hypothetical protein n=1 Tax=Rhodococcus opacus TaxID=37919 RepID=UPI00146BA0DB|nr:hypothetical protein [Rhodococcus opacus]MDJ0420557.1 hypothetical protein [Rhodococcus opacus]MDV7089106.1 hypothetical protein [Rhodococcus opacus]UNN04587.1 hypothetical protein MOO23_36745 [Rhodococcus opacus]WKN52384.1 hypothetical protein HJ581_0000070 [Rhodococcus opacus]